MNNTVEKCFLFPKVKWLQYTGEVGKCTSHWCQISQDLTHQKSLKSVSFWLSYLKNKKVDVFLGHRVVIAGYRLKPFKMLKARLSVTTLARVDQVVQVE